MLAANSQGKVLVAMSGGVDSSVAAALLKREGWEVVGAFMRLGSVGEDLEAPAARSSDGLVRLKIAHRGCCSIEDAHDARAVAARLDIPFYVLNFKSDFARVIDQFVGEYAAGRTPNPCVRCNNWLKFGRLREHAHLIGATHVASGHYARAEQVHGRPALLRGVDRGKDQSYVLFGTPMEDLAKTLYPIGGLPKARVRELAREFSLPVSEKPDSQEICFVPDDDYAGLVERMRPEVSAPGELRHVDGRVLGEHQGQHRFTVGQRKGIRIADSDPLYVVARDAASNTVTVGPRTALATSGCLAREANWLCEPPVEWRAVHACVRYHATPLAARVRMQPEDPSAFEVKFDCPQGAVSPGQACVLYDGDQVLGGGWIHAAV
ncbi:MAG: tRNA 2-thiouridine(34) synthase MnmA [Planctomycetota bacterium]|nr:tRNA 2-thiouridine(34) synthase MnmA [Planctomycetota bacterium]